VPDILELECRAALNRQGIRGAALQRSTRDDHMVWRLGPQWGHVGPAWDPARRAVMDYYVTRYRDDVGRHEYLID